jgi:hypothetical protein
VVERVIGDIRLYNKVLYSGAEYFVDLKGQNRIGIEQFGDMGKNLVRDRFEIRQACPVPFSGDSSTFHLRHTSADLPLLLSWSRRFEN